MVRGDSGATGHGAFSAASPSWLLTLASGFMLPSPGCSRLAISARERERVSVEGPRAASIRGHFRVLPLFGWPPPGVALRLIGAFAAARRWAICSVFGPKQPGVSPGSTPWVAESRAPALSPTCATAGSSRLSDSASREPVLRPARAARAMLTVGRPRSAASPFRASRRRLPHPPQRAPSAVPFVDLATIRVFR